MTATTPAVEPAPGPLRLVTLAARWASARADRAHVIAEGADMATVRAAESRVAISERALHAALAAAVPQYDPSDLTATLEGER